MKKFICLCCTLISGLLSYGQTEFLVTINPATGGFTKVKDLPGVKTIAFLPSHIAIDENSNHFLFKGGDANSNYSLYTVNAATGSIISSTPFPAQLDSLDNFGTLQFDNSTNKLYGLQWDNSQNREYFILVNSTNGTFTKIDSIPGVKSIYGLPSYTTYDKNNHRYYFAGIDGAGISRLYCINAATGSVLSSPAFPTLPNTYDKLAEYRYDNSTNTMYGLHWNNVLNKWFFITVNPTTGSFTDVSSLSGMKFLINTAAFDELHHQFIFNGIDSGGNKYLYSIATNTGSITSKPVFPVLTNTADNVIGLQYNNTTGILYGLHWGSTATGITFTTNQNDAIKIYPNPLITSTSIMLDKTYNEIDLFLYNTQGQVVRKETRRNTSSATILRGTLPNGVYTVSIIGDHISIASAKIVIE